MHYTKLLLSALMAATSLSSLWAQEVRVTVTPESELKSTPRRAVSTACPLVEEDFSSFTAPLPEEFTLDNMLTTPENFAIDSALTHDQEWQGWKVWQNAGSAAILTFDPNNHAYLSTPQMDYSGHIIVTIRVKHLNAEMTDSDGIVHSWTKGSSFQAALINARGKDFSTSIEGSDMFPSQIQLANVRLYDKMGWTEVRIEFDNYSAYNDAYLLFYTSESILIDDVCITASNDNFIASPNLLEVTEVTNDAFTINFEPVRYSYNYYVYLYTLKGYNEETNAPIYQVVIPPRIMEKVTATGLSLDEYLAKKGMTYDDFLKSNRLDDITNAYTYYDIVYSGCSYTFTGLDPHTDYYYAVRSHHVTQFSDFDTMHIHKMDKVATPETQLASNMTSNSFTAMWGPVAKADYYNVNLYAYDIVQEDTEDYIIFDENFDNVSEYTDAIHIFEPEIPDYESDLTINDLTTSPGWELPIYSAILIKGHLGLQPYSVLTSPNLWVAGSDEVYFNVHFLSTSEDANACVMFGDLMYQVPIAGGEFEGGFALPTNGVLESPFQIAGLGCDVYINYIIARQDLKAGAGIYTYMGTYSTEDNNSTSMEFKDLEVEFFPRYAYNVQAVRGEGNDTIRSLANQRVNVDFAQGNSQLKVDNLSDDNLRTVVAIYDINGNEVKSLQKGLNIVKYNDGSVIKFIKK